MRIYAKMTDEELITFFKSYSPANIIETHKFIEPNTFAQWLTLLYRDESGERLVSYSIEQEQRIKPLLDD